jgi:hypothetical protein
VFFKHNRLYGKYAGKNPAAKLLKALAYAAFVALYRFAVRARMRPKLLSLFPAGAVSNIFIALAALIFAIACAFVFLQAKKTAGSAMAAFFRGLGFARKDMLLLALSRSAVPACVAAALIAATDICAIGALSLSSLSRYFYQLFLLSAAILALALPLSFARFPAQAKRQGRKRGFAGTFFFKNKYTANLYKDLQMLRKTPDFAALVFVEIALMSAYCALFKNAGAGYAYFVFLYLLMWFAATLSEDIFQIDCRYAVPLKALIPDNRELFRIKRFELFVLCALPALVFALANAALLNASAGSFVLSAAIAALMGAAFSSGGAAIGCMCFPKIKGGWCATLITCYILLSLFPPLALMLSAGLAYRFWRVENAHGQQAAKNI